MCAVHLHPVEACLAREHRRLPVGLDHPLDLFVGHPMGSLSSLGLSIVKRPETSTARVGVGTPEQAEVRELQEDGRALGSDRRGKRPVPPQCLLGHLSKGVGVVRLGDDQPHSACRASPKIVDIRLGRQGRVTELVARAVRRDDHPVPDLPGTHDDGGK